MKKTIYNLALLYMVCCSIQTIKLQARSDTSYSSDQKFAILGTNRTKRVLERIHCAPEQFDALVTEHIARRASQRVLSDLLTIAAGLGKFDSVQALIAAGASVNNYNQRTRVTPLMASLCAPQMSRTIFDYLLEHGTNDATINAEEGVVLELALVLGKKDCADTLIARGANREAALISFILKRDIDSLLFLIDRGADVNVRYNSGNTPLAYAVRELYAPTVEILLKNGAHPNVIANPRARNNHDKVSALTYAVIYNQSEIVDLLLKYGASLDYDREYCGGPDNALHYAADYADDIHEEDSTEATIKIAQKLLDAGSNPLSSYTSGKYTGLKPIDRLLISVYLHQSDPSSKTYKQSKKMLDLFCAHLEKMEKQGVKVPVSPLVSMPYKRTTLERAVDIEHMPLISYLLRHGSDPNEESPSARGYSPLFSAVFARNEAMVELLLSHGADPLKPHKKRGGLKGYTPLRLATEKELFGIVELFKKHLDTKKDLAEVVTLFNNGRPLSADNLSMQSGVHYKLSGLKKIDIESSSTTVRLIHVQSNVAELYFTASPGRATTLGPCTLFSTPGNNGQWPQKTMSIMCGNAEGELTVALPVTSTFHIKAPKHLIKRDSLPNENVS